MEIRMVMVPAIIDGDSIIVVTEQGRLVSSRIPISTLNLPQSTASVVSQLQWRRWAAKEKLRTASLFSRRKKRVEGWASRIENWVSSIRIRVRLENRACNVGDSRLFSDSYETTTWTRAFDRMWHQANNRARRVDMDPWVRWTQTASNNSNKRKGGKYGG